MSKDTLTLLPVHTKITSTRTDRAGLWGMIVDYREGSAYVAWHDHSYSFENPDTLVEKDA